MIKKAAIEKFNWSVLPQEVIGAVLRTKNNVKPIFVSPGYQCTIKDAIAFTKSVVGKYRLPEPTRIAHNLVNEFRKKSAI